MADPTEAEMMADLRAADAAGDTDLAQHIASRIKAARGPQMAPSHTPGATVPGGIPPSPGRDESAARGGLQGVTMGWGDEAAAAIAAALPFTDREAAYGDTIGERYQSAREFYRGKNAAAEQANPGTYLAGQVAGASAPTLLGAAPALGTKAALALAAGQGAAQGAGYSEREDIGLLGDTALGTGLGLAGYGAGALVGKGVAAAKRAGSRLVRTGTSRAAQQGAEEATAAVRSLEGAARERAANAYRQMERINLALADKALPAEERAALEAFKRSPEYAALLSANAKGALAAAPEAAAEREAAAAIASQARADLPNAIRSRTGELLTTQAKPDLKSLFKMYGEPMLWAMGGQQLGSALGLDPAQQGALAGAAGLIGGRTRAGKAILTRINRPAHQAALGRALERAVARAESPMVLAMRRGLAAGVPAAVTDRTEEDR
jgi:hypothetical protein